MSFLSYGGVGCFRKENDGKILKSEGLSTEMGLTVHVATDEDSYMYPLVSTIGTNVSNLDLIQFIVRKTSFYY